MFLMFNVGTKCANLVYSTFFVLFYYCHLIIVESHFWIVFSPVNFLRSLLLLNEVKLGCIVQFLKGV